MRRATDERLRYKNITFASYRDLPAARLEAVLCSRGLSLNHKYRADRQRQYVCMSNVHKQYVGVLLVCLTFCRNMRAEMLHIIYVYVYYVYLCILFM